MKHWGRSVARVWGAALVLAMMGGLSSCDDGEDHVALGGSSGSAGSGGSSSAGSSATAGGNAGSAGSTGNAGGTQAGETSGGGDAGGGGPTYVCGCPDGYVFHLNDASQGEYPSCDPPPGECTVPSAYCERPHAYAACASGACEFDTCVPGWDDCDEDAANGCETDLRQAAHCGACDNTCGNGQTCRDGVCVDVCQPPRVECNGRCVNLATSGTDCGSCGNDCGTQACERGSCSTTTCETGYDFCTSEYECRIGVCETRCGECPPLYGIDTSCVTKLDQCCGGPNSDFAYDNALRGEHDEIESGLPHCYSKAPVPKCVQCPEVIFVPGLKGPDGIAIAAGRLYWADADNAEIGVVDLSTGMKSTLQGELSRPRDVAVNGDYVYFSDELAMAIFRKKIDGTGQLEKVADADEPYTLALDEQDIYWIDNGTNSIKRAPQAGGDAEVLWQGSEHVGNGFPEEETAATLAVDDTYVYTVRLLTYFNNDDNAFYRRFLKSNPGSYFEQPLLGPVVNPQLSLFDGTASVATSFDPYGAAYVLSVSGPGTAQVLSGASASPQAVLRTSKKTYFALGSTLANVPNCPGAVSNMMRFGGDVIHDFAIDDGWLYFSVQGYPTSFIGRVPVDE